MQDGIYVVLSGSNRETAAWALRVRDVDPQSPVDVTVALPAPASRPRGLNCAR